MECYKVIKWYYIITLQNKHWIKAQHPDISDGLSYEKKIFLKLSKGSKGKDCLFLLNRMWSLLVRKNLHNVSLKWSLLLDRMVKSSKSNLTSHKKKCSSMTKLSQEASTGGVLKKKCSLKFRKIHRKTPVPKTLF